MRARMHACGHGCMGRCHSSRGLLEAVVDLVRYGADGGEVEDHGTGHEHLRESSRKLKKVEL